MMADDEPVLETVVSGKCAMIDCWGDPSTADRKRAAQILKSIECSHLAPGVSCRKVSANAYSLAEP
jgi:hypothetical protein